MQAVNLRNWQKQQEFPEIINNPTNYKTTKP